MLDPLIISGQYEGQKLSTVTDKTFLIQYRTIHNGKFSALDLLAINTRIRQLHKQTQG